LGFIQSAHILAIYVVILVFIIVPKLCLMALGACALVLVLIASKASHTRSKNIYIILGRVIIDSRITIASPALAFVLCFTHLGVCR
jgi:hypothetical protein